MANILFTKWLRKRAFSDRQAAAVSVFLERQSARAIGLKELRRLAVDHFVGDAAVARLGGLAKAANIILNSLPANKRTRSGDLGELLGTEYVASQTPFAIPIKKLRWKSDREMPMHGNDIVGIHVDNKAVRVLKGECKSRANCTAFTITEAATVLDGHEGRPNPSTLAFIAKRLLEEKRDTEAKVFLDLQTKRPIPAKDIRHLVFVLSGNDATAHLSGAPKSKHAGISRECVGVVVTGHSAFVALTSSPFQVQS